MADVRLCCLFVFFLFGHVFGSSDDMSKIMTGFTKVLDECKQELNIQDNIMADFYHYWKEDYDLVNREMGCVIICMSKKLDLLDEEGKLHHGNAAEFATKNGADASTAAKVVEIIHACEKTAGVGVADECLHVLEIAKCFRTRIHELNWAPSVKVVIEEVLTEI